MKFLVLIFKTFTMKVTFAEKLYFEVRSVYVFKVFYNFKRGRKCLTEEVKQQRLVEKTREKAAKAAAKALKATQPSSKKAKK